MGIKRLGWNGILANSVGNCTGWYQGDEKIREEMREMKHQRWNGYVADRCPCVLGQWTSWP